MALLRFKHKCSGEKITIETHKKQVFFTINYNSIISKVKKRSTVDDYFLLLDFMKLTQFFGIQNQA